LQGWIQSSTPIKKTCPICRQEIKDFQIDYILKDWESLFNSALSNLDEDMMILLIQRGVDIDILKKENEDGWLVMNLIVSWKLNRLIEILCKKQLITIDDINRKQTFQGYTALHIAAMYNNFTACSLFLNQDHKSEKSEIEKSEIVNVTSNNLLTPLVFAVYEKSFQVLKILLDHGADPNIEKRDKNTCLFLKMNLETCQLLLDHGANVNKKNNKGNTPLHFFVGYYHQEETNRERDQKKIDDYFSIIKLLLDGGASVNEKNDLGETPYMIAYKHGLTSVCELLSFHGASTRNGGERVGEKRPRDNNNDDDDRKRGDDVIDRVFFYCFF